MPVLRGNPDNQYVKANGWKMWTDEAATSSMRSEGWKLHVGGNAQQAQNIVSAILPGLQELGVVHKFLPDTDDFALQTEEQTGKWFAVYPNSVLHAFLCVYAIDAAIARLGIARGQITAIPNDLPVGNTVVYARYGGYAARTCRDPATGSLKADQVSSSYKPGWIADPWGSYAATNNLGGTVNPAWSELFPRYNPRGRLV